MSFINNKKLQTVFIENNKVTKIYVGNNLVYQEQITPTVEPYLTFSSPNSFTLSIVNNQKYWDGTLETSTDKTTWTTWSGTSAVSSASDGTNHNIYVRGIANTYITGSSASVSAGAWRLNGSNISISGDIENLLDYATVQQGNHPAKANGCYKALFGNSSLNSNITDVSNLKLSANNLATEEYRSMFTRASGITVAPQLLATIYGDYCCYSMFAYCTSLITPAKMYDTHIGAHGCYYMYINCSNLEKIPLIHATIIRTYGCSNMFRFCSNLKISETQSAEYLNEYYIPNATIEQNALTGMFALTGGTFGGTPTINTTYYTSNEVI